MTALTVCLLLGAFVLVNCDMTFPDLNRLYNAGVKSAEWVTRPKQGMPGWVPNTYPTTHSGVRVTLTDGRQFLIHKGRGYGQASNTVVTDAAHMSDKWQLKQSQDFGGSRTVGDFVKAGGEEYSILRGQQCHTAAKDMMNQKKK